MREASSRELRFPSPDQSIGFLEHGEDSPSHELLPQPSLAVLARGPGLHNAIPPVSPSLPQMAEIDTPQSLDVAGGQ
jgi:hypothetical protein